jgi:hypothetical protein
VERILGPDEAFPDIDALNEKTPRSEWREDPFKPGEMKGPWMKQSVVHLIDPATMAQYSFPTSTKGGFAAVRELRKKIVWMRRLRGGKVYPVVHLRDTFMPTQFKGRQRPDFKIVRWISFSPDDEAQTLPAPPTLSVQQQLNNFAAAGEAPQANTPAAADSTPSPATPKAPTTTLMTRARIVEPPTAAEEMGDEIPFDGSSGKSGRAGSRAPAKGKNKSRTKAA